MVIDPSSEFFRAMRGSGPAPAAARGQRPAVGASAWDLLLAAWR